MEKIILASNSPRRKELFSLFGWPFEVKPADIDEDSLEREKPKDYVARLARGKADVVASQQKGLVIAADTIVVDGEQLLGKPRDKEDARKMLEKLRGRIHQVYTGIAIIHTQSEQTYEVVCLTNVPMRYYSDQEIEAYVAGGDPMDKAGAYAIQHAGFNPVSQLSGCYASVMGLPLCHLLVGLRRFNLEIPHDLPGQCQDYLGYDCPVFTEILGRV
jgi:MAF protein